MAGKYSIVAAGDGISAARETLVTYLNTGTKEAPVWSAMGAKVTDSSIEYDWGLESSTDILGVTRSKAKVAKQTQSFAGNEIVAGDAVMNHLLDIAVVQKSAELVVAQDVLIVHTYLQDEAGKAFAERYPTSAVVPTTRGGEGGGPLVSDINVEYGGERSVGTAAVEAGVVTFTPTVEV